MSLMFHVRIRQYGARIEGSIDNILQVNRSPEIELAVDEAISLGLGVCLSVCEVASAGMEYV